MSEPHSTETGQTFLFVPGTRPERFEKAFATGADVVVFDLEDSVAPSDKLVARTAVEMGLREGPKNCAVRVNGAGTPWHDGDVSMVAGVEADLMLPKCEDLGSINSLPEPAGRVPRVLALIETPTGIVRALEIALHEAVMRLAFGSLDYAATLGLDAADREALLQARQQLVLASGAAGLPPPVDGVTVSIDDDGAAAASDAAYAKRLGFMGKLCIHPSQVHPVGGGFVPTRDEKDWARRVLDSVHGSTGAEGRATVLDGAMIDPPVLQRAESILRQVRAGEEGAVG